MTTRHVGDEVRETMTAEEQSARIKLEGRVEALERFVERVGRVLPVLDGAWRKTLVTVRGDVRGLIADADRIEDQVDKVTTAFPEIARAAVEANERLTRRLETLAQQEGLLPAGWPVQLQSLIDLARKPMVLRDDEVVLLDGPRRADVIGPVIVGVLVVSFCIVHSAAALVMWLVGLMGAVAVSWWRSRRPPTFRVTRERLLSVRNGPSFSLRDATWRADVLFLQLFAGRQILTVPGSWRGADAMQAVLLLHDLKKLGHAMPLRHEGTFLASGPGGEGMIAFGLTHLVFVSRVTAPHVQRVLFGERESPVSESVLCALLAMLDDADFISALPTLSGDGGIARTPMGAVSFQKNKKSVWLTAGRVSAKIDTEVWRRITT